MGSFSLVHWLILLAVILLFFGAGRLPHVMGDFAKGIKAFKAGMRDDDQKPAAIPEGAPPASAQAPRSEQKIG